MVLIGNIISFFGCILMVAVGFIKRKEHMLATQFAQFSMQAVANLVLGSVSGSISCVIGVIRIVVFTRVKKVRSWMKIAFLALQAVITYLTGAVTLIQWVPVISMVAYTWYLDTDNEVLFKAVNLLGVCMWLFHDIHYINYSAAAFDIMTIVSTTVGVILLLVERRKGRTKNVQ